ncbi:uncharacterized protein ACR2FA_012046 [Aphomia sociella]
MHAKIVFVFMVVLIMVAGNPLQISPRLYDSSLTTLEEACVRQGGICMPIENCDPGNLVQLRGVLCSNSYHSVRECCYIW